MARPIADAAEEAVSAAGALDAPSFASAVARLGTYDPAQVGLLLGTVVRHALESGHPDGLGSDDIRDTLTAVVTDARQWQTDLDPQVFLLLLAGALGVHEPDPDDPPVEPDVSARHAVLLVTHLVEPAAFPARLEAAATELAQHAE
ncbi:hypothetical protein O7635_28585 [Asanoa sp. WMMD1127]|uniref:hypothetical protein n=1 Tax=Asanoa sp. WMMD1127 TaxID=3016107 RepID=UPI0024178728|nr:hypothetical protein [Asanoa sp. WMMD1127]MDG4825823.1 hypothetical protein [Asanoa sp. WMMD1127]